MAVAMIDGSRDAASLEIVEDDRSGVNSGIAMATAKGDAHDIGEDQALADHQRQGFSRVER